MKVLKLIITFAIILGGVVLAAYLAGGGPGIGISIGEQSDFDVLKNKISKNWAEKSDWDKELFDKNIELITQSKNDLDGSAQTLYDQNYNEAVKIINDKIIAQWASAGCAHSVVDKYYGAITTIGSKEQYKKRVASDANIAKIRKIYSVYKNALALSTKSLGSSPGFNGSSWNSYDVYCSKIRSQRNSILNDNTYKTYLKNITSIKSGLNSIDNKLASGRTAFYNKLATEIKAYFESREKSFENLSKLTTVCGKYNNECGNGALNSYYSKYEYDLYNM